MYNYLIKSYLVFVGLGNPARTAFEGCRARAQTSFLSYPLFKESVILYVTTGKFTCLSVLLYDDDDDSNNCTLMFRINGRRRDFWRPP